MRKERKVPSIVKPLIDEETALAFASTSPASASKGAADKSGGAISKRSAAGNKSDDAIGKNMVRISIAVKKSLYDRIAKEAARKNRTVDEHLKRHLAKHYGK
jgi:hypothetical protein